MAKLWGGRFSEEPDQRFARFNASLSFDRRLAEIDIRASCAHCQALHQAGMLSLVEKRQIVEALESIRDEIAADQTILDRAVAEGIEDIHSVVEKTLVERVGDLGRKLHTGRSRNDQVATDLRIWTREAVDRVLEALHALRRTLVGHAEAAGEIPIPGYTHLQPAQPLLLAHYLLAYFEMFQRDSERFADARRRVDVLPLGAGALAGTNYPLDRALEADLLGFAEISANSLDAVSDRDFVVECVSAACVTMMHLSRLAEDWILYASREFGFLKLGDKVSTGSSLMPQKKNPDGLELIRGKTGRVFGHLTALLTTLKGLPMAYNKDLQEDKEPLFDTFDTLLDCLSVAVTIIDNSGFDENRLRQAVEHGYLNATDLADYLAARGVPFRKAHELTGRVVLAAIEQGCRLQDLSLDELRAFSDVFQEDVFEQIGILRALAAKSVPGGTAPVAVARAIEEAKKKLEWLGNSR